MRNPFAAVGDAPVLVQDYQPGWEANLPNFQKYLDAGWPAGPLAIAPAKANNKSDYLFTNTLVIPASTGWKFTGNGYSTPSGTGSQDYTTNLTSRAISTATTFEGDLKTRLDPLPDTKMVRVIGRVVAASDLYQGLEILSGTDVIPGWYGITAVDVEKNYWTLDRPWRTNASAGVKAYYAPELIQSRAKGTVWDGIFFKGRRLDADNKDAAVLFHQCTDQQANNCTGPGKNHFTDCGFYAAKVGILQGHDMRCAYYEKYGYREPQYGTYRHNHADHLNLDKVWFQDVDTCVYLRNEQSVSNSFRDIRVSELNGEVFRLDAGGVIDGCGFWISGRNCNVVRLGSRANNGLVHLRHVHFDHACIRPRLLVCDENATDLHCATVFDGGTLSVLGNIKPDWPLIDALGDCRVVVRDFVARSHGDDVYGFWAGALRLRSAGNYTPLVVMENVQLAVDRLEELISSDSALGATIIFKNCYRYGGSLYRDGCWVVGRGWVS